MCCLFFVNNSKENLKIMDKITMESWLKVYHNDFIFTKILGMFDLEEQIALMTVCQRFQYIISDVIWKEKFHDSRIAKKFTAFDMVGLRKQTHTSEAIYDRHNFEQRELYEILEFLCPHFKSLTIASDVAHSRRSPHKGVVFNFLGNFENLQVLKYNDVLLKDENIKAISERCKRLKELHLVDTGNKLTGMYLDELHNLEAFCTTSTFMTWPYEKLFDICKLPLKNLQLTNIIYGEKPTNFICDTGNLAETLEVFTADCDIFPSDDAFDILRYSSKPFARLHELKISRSIEHVDSYHIDLISEKCLNLQRLSFNWFEKFLNEDSFKLPMTLKELYLENGIVSAENAWYILTELNLSVLHICCVEPSKMNNLSYSHSAGCSLETLQLERKYLSDDEERDFWIELFENCTSDFFGQLKSLNCISITDRYLDLISNIIPNIEHLYIKFSKTTGRNIYLFKKLKSLNFTCNKYEICHIIQIMQTLGELESLTLDNCVIVNVNPDDDVPVQSIGSCSLRRLSFDYDNFLSYQQFWLNLLRLNLMKIEILCHYQYFSDEYHLELLSAVFEDTNILKNLDRFELYGEIWDPVLEHRERFVEILYHPSLRNHVRRVRVNHCDIDTSVSKSECMKRIVCSLSFRETDFSIEFK